MGDKVQIWHNATCSKSNDVCSWLSEHNIDVEIIEYTETPISKIDLQAVLKKLNLPAYDLIRKKEELFQNNWKDAQLSEDEWQNILVQNPVLIERPIVIRGDKAVIARPLENINTLFKD